VVNGEEHRESVPMQAQLRRFRKLLGLLTLAVLAAILYLGLWPYNFSAPSGVHWLKASSRSRLIVIPPNEVEWIENSRGLHFGDFGSIFSLANFAAGSNSSDGCTFEVWLEPAVTEDFTTTLAFSTEHNPLQFRLRQLEDSLAVSHDTLDEKGRIHTDKIWVEHVFHEHTPLQITLSSGPNGTGVYLNGKLRRNYDGFHLRSSDFTGRFVFGNSPVGHETWAGLLKGIAIFPTAVSAQRATEDFAVWNSGSEFAPSVASSAVALFYFKEGQGRVTRSEIAGVPDLILPHSFQTMRPILLKSIWEEYDGNLDYWIDTLLNVIAFVPLGFFMCSYFSSVESVRRPGLITILLGFLVSLTIELGQYYLPMRNSGMTDLVTNTLGTALGVWVLGVSRVQRAMSYIVDRLRLAGREPAGVAGKAIREN